MGDDITVASTTDTQEQVEQAAGVAPAEVEEQEEVEQEEGTEKVEEQEEEPAEEEEEEPAEEEEEEEEPVEEEPTAKKTKSPTDFLPKSVRKRVSKLTARNHSLEDEAASLRRRVAELEAGGGTKKDDTAPVVAKPAVVLPANLKEPKEEDFTDYKQYIAALARYNTKVAEYELNHQRQQEAENERTKLVFDDYNRGVSDAQLAYDDFNEVVGNPKLTISPAARIAIIELGGDIGPHVAYYLGSHPEELDNFTGMSNMQQIMRIGQIAEQFAAEDEEEKPASKKRTVTTRASAPIRPVTRAGNKTKTSVPLDQMPFRDYKRIREEQERGRRS